MGPPRETAVDRELEEAWISRKSRGKRGTPMDAGKYIGLVQRKASAMFKIARS